jgi:hypothetical protein
MTMSLRRALRMAAASLALVVSGVLFSSTCHGQQTVDYRSSWNALPAHGRLGFISGYMAGIRDEAAMAHTTTGYEAFHLTEEQILDGVDDCYRDIRTRRISPRGCIAWTFARTAGASDAQLTKLLDLVREGK